MEFRFLFSGLVILIVLNGSFGQNDAPEIVTVEGEDEADDSTDGTEEEGMVRVNGTRGIGDYTVGEHDQWQPRFCLIIGMECAGHDLDGYPVSASNPNECLTLCVETENCRGAHFRDGQCWLKDHRCNTDEMTPRPDGQDYWRKVVEDPGCPLGRSPIGIKEEGWTEKYCEAPNKFCSAVVLQNSNAATGFECMGQCSRLEGCRSAHFKNWNCKLMKYRCSEDKLLDLPGGVQYYRLEDGEECSKNRPQYESSRKQWGSRYCYKVNKFCEGHDIYRKAQNIDIQEKCLKKCMRVEGCRSVGYRLGECHMKDYRCSAEELVDLEGFIDFYRLRKDEEKCPDDYESGAPPTLWAASFCKAEDKRCGGGDALQGYPKNLKTGECVTDCLSLCAKNAKCGSVFYEPNEKLCVLKNYRCQAGDLTSYVGGDDFYRLEMGEKCPENREVDEGEWDARFCYIPGKYCIDSDIPGSPFPVDDFQECLKKCVDVEGCLSVRHDDDGQCTLKTVRCAVEDAVVDESTNSYLRLKSDEVGCPDNRVPKLPSCPPSSKYSEEADGCPATCRSLAAGEDSCEFEPNPGCECADGYVLDDENKCIPEGQCNCYDEQGVERYVGLEWLNNDCSKKFICDGSGDEAPETRETGLACPVNSICEVSGLAPRCKCSPGYESKDGECSPYLQCGAFSTYQTEASACRDTCSHRDAVYYCQEQTKVVACVCDPGYLYDDLGEECIPEANCGCFLDGEAIPVGQKWTSDDCKQLYECKLGEYGAEIAFEEHCCPDNSVCSTENGGAECVCLEGFERREDGTCIPPIECPENSEFTPDASHCPNTCENRTASTTCLEESTPGCQCLGGFYLKEKQCVGVEKCGCVDLEGVTSKVGDTWTVCNKEYKCTMLDGEPAIVEEGETCPKNSYCEDDECKCTEGFVKDDAGNCIPDYKCPENSDYADPATPCPNTCRQPEASQSCVQEPDSAGCNCREGFLQDDSADCIPAVECPCYDDGGFPKEAESIWTTVDCKTEFTCNPGSPPYVSQRSLDCGQHAECRGVTEYEAECPCDEGYVRVEDGSCQPVKECDWHQHVVLNGSCPATCDDPRAELGCVEQERIDACTCNDGYVLNAAGKCVAPAQCGCFDVEKNITRKVGDEWNPACNEFSTCVLGKNGQPNIKKRTESCPENSHCEENTCECDEGYVKQVDGSCKEDEPEEPTCDEPSIFSFSAPPLECEDTCRHPDRVATCQSPSRPGCMCPATHVLNDTGACMSRRECPCFDENEELREVGEEWISKDCETKTTCVAREGQTPGLEVTEYECPDEPCPKGMERQPDGTCKLPEDCEEEPPKLIAVVQKLFIYRLPELFGKECSSNSKLVSDASACPNTCANPQAKQSCDLPPVTACECHEGHLLDHVLSECIPIASCGCYDGFGTPHPLGAVWYSTDCDKLFSCGIEGDLPNIQQKECDCQQCMRDENNLPYCADEGAPGNPTIGSE